MRALAFLNKIVNSFCVNRGANQTSTLHDFSESDPIEPSLRQFEILMLSEIGYAINFTTEAHSQKPIETDLDYVFIVEKGFVSKQDQNPDSFGIKGHVIKAINEGLLPRNINSVINDI